MQSNKIVEALKIQMIAAFKDSIRRALSSFQILVSKILGVEFEIRLGNRSFKISREVDRRQINSHRSYTALGRVHR
jgi:hypothetical protein